MGLITASYEGDQSDHKFSGMTPEVNRNGPMDMNMYSVRSKKCKEENTKKPLGKAPKTRVYTPVARASDLQRCASSHKEPKVGQMRSFLDKMK